jgi:hypothetical protein
MRQRKLAKRAHQVVLAALVRDEHGQVLVTQEGLLPSRTITEELYFAVSHLLVRIVGRANWCIVSWPP